MRHSPLAEMLGSYIYEERINKAIRQVELAEVLEFSAQFLGRIEKGEVMIPENALIRCVNYLNLKPTRLRRIYRTAADETCAELLKKAKSKNR